MTLSNTKLIPFIILLVALVARLFAHFAELMMGIEPCILCLHQRKFFMAVIVCAAVAAFSKRLFPSAFLAFCIVSGLGFSLYHVGVENKYFPAPTQCDTKSPVDLTAPDLTYEQKMAMLKAEIGKRKPVACDEVSWRIFSLSATIWTCLLWVGLVLLGGYHLWIVRRTPPLNL